MSKKQERSVSIASDPSDKRKKRIMIDNKIYNELPIDGAYYYGCIKEDNFICSRCNKEKGHFDTILRHYAVDHPEFIKKDLYHLATPYQYLSTLAKAQIEMLIKKKTTFKNSEKKLLNEVLIDMIFRESTLNLIKDYENKKFNEKSSKGFCPISLNIINGFINKIEKHISSFKKCVNEINFECPSTEEKLNGVSDDEIKKFFELNFMDKNSNRAIFFITNFDQNDEKNDKEKRKNQNEINKKYKSNEYNLNSSNDEENEISENDEKNKKRKKSYLNNNNGGLSEIKASRRRQKGKEIILPNKKSNENKNINNKKIKLEYIELNENDEEKKSPENNKEIENVKDDQFKNNENDDEEEECEIMTGKERDDEINNIKRQVIYACGDYNSSSENDNNKKDEHSRSIYSNNNPSEKFEKQKRSNITEKFCDKFNKIINKEDNDENSSILGKKRLHDEIENINLKKKNKNNTIKINVNSKKTIIDVDKEKNQMDIEQKNLFNNNGQRNESPKKTDINIDNNKENKKENLEKINEEQNENNNNNFEEKIPEEKDRKEQINNKNNEEKKMDETGETENKENKTQNIQNNNSGVRNDFNLLDRIFNYNNLNNNIQETNIPMGILPNKTVIVDIDYLASLVNYFKENENKKKLEKL